MTMPSNLPASSVRRGASLAMLFYIVTVAAMLAACLRSLESEESISIVALVTILVIASAVSGAVGFVAGWLRIGKFRYALLGAFLGMAMGAVAGLLIQIRPEHFVNSMNTLYLGCWCIMLIMLTASRFSDRRMRRENEDISF